MRNWHYRGKNRLRKRKETVIFWFSKKHPYFCLIFCLSFSILIISLGILLKALKKAKNGIYRENQLKGKEIINQKKKICYNLPMFELGNQWKKPCEFQGQRYNSITEMCNAYGILPETYNRRIKVYGWSQEKALLTPAKKNGGVAFYDHTGTRFKSFSKMCEAYGKSRKTVQYRLDNNWDLERALTT